MTCLPTKSKVSTFFMPGTWNGSSRDIGVWHLREGEFMLEGMGVDNV